MKKKKSDINDELIKQLLDSVDDPKDLFGKGGLMQQLTKKMVEAALRGEMDAHLGYEKHEKTGVKSKNNWLFKRKKWLFFKNYYHRSRTN